MVIITKNTASAFITFTPTIFTGQQLTNTRIIRKRPRLPSIALMSSIASQAATPVLVCDVLDTLVEDPFTHGMHTYFGFDTLKDFISAKEPGTWLKFERGEIDEVEFGRTFFLKSSQNSNLDVFKFKQYLMRTYRLISGVDSLLNSFKQHQIPVHLCSNYPLWYTLIEDTVKLQDHGANWTFVSALYGKRKPDPEAYNITAKLASVTNDRCVLLDDRESNCVGARDAGYRGAVKFVDVEQARRDLAPFFGSWLLEPTKPGQ